MSKDTGKGIAKNTSVMFLQYVATWGSTFILTLFLPRYLGPVEYGRIFLATSVTFIFGMFVHYGGYYAIAKDVSRSPGDTAQIMVDAYAFRAVFALIACAAMMGFAFWMGYPSEVKILLLIFGISFLWLGGITTLYACYQGHELMQYPSIALIVDRGLVAVAAVIGLLLGGKATLMVIIGVSGNILNLLVLTRFSKRIIDRIPRVRWTDVVRQVKEGIPYFLFAIFGAVSFRIDSMVLAKLSPEEVLGWYGGGKRLIEALNFIPAIFSTALYPVLSRL